ncbi:PAS domain S-box protein [Geomonas sp. RF6]|uniref:PAS domain S-box protein n=1 Tax=Geomonas sp. RF6 TaxID=2897342 RepID=UPI001E338B2E|nr:PAS domain S-box protein [Geomonas sp. RF6]UFS70915.1 PAS domain S-box protein [Geomonas sp. RF6]
MSKFSTITIRAQLFFMALIIALPAAGIIVYSGLKQREEALVKARVETQKVVANLVSEQQTLVACAKQLLSTLALLPDVRNHNEERVRSILAQNLQINPQFLNIFILDAKGKLWASAVPGPPGLDAADRRYFQNAVRTGRFSSGECIVDRILHKPALSFGYPYRNERGEIAGVVCANFDLNYCSRTLERFRLPAGSSCLMVDRNGVIVGKGINPVGYIGMKSTGKQREQLLNTRDGETMVSPGVDGVVRYSSYRRIFLEGESSPYMYIRAGIPMKSVYGSANMALITNLFCLLPFLALAFYVAGRIGKHSIVDRVAVLHSASQRFARGDLDVRVSELVQGGELGSLGASFDAMASSLQREQKALRESENNFRTLAETANDGMLVVAEDGALMYANSRIAQILGYSAHKLIGADITELAPAEELPRWKSLLRVAGEKDQQQYETRVVTTGGGEVPVEVTCSSTLWHGCSASLVIVRDISDRKRVEEDLRASYNILQRTFASLNETVLIVGAEGGIIEACNDMAKRMLGFSVEELVGRRVADLHVSPEMYEHFCEMRMKMYREKGYFEATYKLRRKDGTIFDSEHVITPIRSESGAVVSHVGVIRDITERKRQEEMLQAKALVLENMAEGVSECAGDGTILFTNPAFDAIFGYPKGELLGKNVSILGHRPSGDSGAFPPDVAGSLKRHGMWFGEFANRKKDGTIFHTYARVNVVPCSGNWITVLDDITERQEMERMKDGMISAVSHEMRTPLTALIGYFQIIQEKGLADPQLREYLETMYNETVRLNELIGNFLDLQRLKARKALYSFKPLALNSLITDTAALFANTSKKHHITLNVDSELPAVIGDEDRLHQVFNNLLSNAIKYSPAGGEIVLTTRSEGSNVAVSVQDRGIGIPPEALNKIFERFYRVDNTDARTVGGTGLGLALVREVIDTHGGNVRVESVLGKGSTFQVSLPVAEKTYNAQMIS